MKKILAKQDKKTYVREYYANGNIKTIHEVVDNKRHGVSKYYYESGKIQAIAHFNMNKYHGEQTSYYPNGKVRGKLNYINHKKHGTAYGYYEDGSLFTEENYVNGLLTGVKKKYYNNGKLMMENQFLEGKPSINLKEYNVKGELVTDYPKLLIEKDNRLINDNKYIIKVFFSNHANSAKFYINYLVDDQYLPVSSIQLPTEKGIGSYTLLVNPGEKINDYINIIGTVKTRLGNTLVVSKSVKVDVKH